MFRLLLLLSILYIPWSGNAQESKKANPIICHANPYEERHTPTNAVNLRNQPLSSFEFRFASDVPFEAQKAMEFAADIWAQHLVSDVPIVIEVSWDRFDEENVLASAGPTALYRDFSFRAERDIWYPVALAEAILGENINDNEPDLSIIANSQQDWYYGLDGRVPFGDIDLVSVILHELGHGLGFLSSADLNEDGQGALGYDERNLIFDEFLETSSGVQIADPVRFPSPSFQLRNAYTSSQLFFGSNSAAGFNRGRFPELYTPRTFEQGSSVSHLDEFAFPAGSENALMSPRLGFREAVHEPGAVNLSIMEAIGWETNTSRVVTSTQELSLAQVSVFPNPAREQVTIDWPDSFGNSTNYQILDGMGRIVQNGALEGNARISVQQMAPGTYYLRLFNNQENHLRQLVIIR